MTGIIIVMGTPGVGKSTIAGRLARQLDYRHLDISRLVESDQLYSGLDRKRRTLIVDPKRLNNKLKEAFGDRDTQGFVVSTHYTDGIPQRLQVDVAFVLRLDPPVLYRRLLQRGWTNEKVWENVESELVGVCLTEALERFGRHRVVEIDTTKRSRENLLTEMIQIAGSKNRVKGRAGVVDWLESFEPEDWKGKKIWKKKARSNSK